MDRQLKALTKSGVLLKNMTNCTSEIEIERGKNVPSLLSSCLQSFETNALLLCDCPGGRKKTLDNFLLCTANCPTKDSDSNVKHAIVSSVLSQKSCKRHH